MMFKILSIETTNGETVAHTSEWFGLVRDRWVRVERTTKTIMGPVTYSYWANEDGIICRYHVSIEKAMLVKSALERHEAKE